ncbi:PASTA domain-containing protein [Paenibacillus flagellatus]|uniref:PASTA domain-containing protein n=1 Tax=Paenibacillus flagellatus TaxID=2211139 RepID=A0A2V5KUD4_9BACL|nr:PASTA domain-containing protein [Paenibacillus flagellatus]PYI55497.1 hypothetical protein DLM86_07115 [Paenibacillus flagellatus]
MNKEQDRYALDALLSPLNGGRLYAGQDLALRRPVLVYEIPIRGTGSTDETVRAIGHASPSSGKPPFLHLLDVEVGADSIRVAIDFKKGQPFRQFVRMQPLPVQEAAAIVAEFGEALLDAAEDRALDVSLDPDNVWVTDDRKLHLIDGWSRSERGERLSKSVAGLLFLLVTGDERVPADSERIAHALRQSMRDASPALKSMAVSAVVNAWREQLSLSSLLQHLGRLSEASTVRGRETTAARPAIEDVRPANAPRKAESAETARAFVRRIDDEPAEDAGTSERVRPEPAEDGVTDQSEPAKRRSPLLRVGKRIWQGLAFAVIGLTVFAVAFVLLVETMSRGDKEAAVPAGAAVEEKPQTGGAQKPEQPAKPGPSNASEKPADAAKPPAAGGEGSSNGNGNGGTVAATEGDTVTVPSLVGLSKADAEKQALAAGLRYSYFLEANAQAAAGTVFKQDPAPDGKVAKGSRVTFYVSKGSNP